MSEMERQQNNLGGRVNEMKYLYIVIGLSFLVALPVLFMGFPVDGHDSPSQFNLYAAFSRQVWMGELYPRWLIDMNGGFGSPVFFFYPPMAYYITTFFSVFIGQPTTDNMIWQQLGLSAGLAIIGSGIACYLWLKEITSVPAAAIGSVVYLIVPYHISIDLFTRGALAEVWAFVWMPLILKFVKILYQKPVIGLIGLALSYSMLVMTHLPTALIFSLIPICYGLVLQTGERRKIQLLLMILGMGIGIGIADIYLMPALTARNYVSFDSNPLSHLHYARNFLFSFSADDYSPYIVQLTIILVTMISGILFCVLANKNLRLLNLEQKFWLVIAGVSIFLMTPLSQPIWQLIPILQSIQFPYRFNAVLCVAYTGLLAVTLSNFSFNKQHFSGDWRKKILIYGTAVLCCVWVGFFIEAVIKEKPSEYKEYIKKMYGQKLDFVEHMPQTARLDRLDSLIVEKRESGSSYLVRATDKQVQTEVIQWKPRDIVLSVETNKSANLVVGQFYYPGWKAAFYPDSGKPLTNLSVEPSEEGLLSVQILEESGRLELNLTNQTEQSGLFVSIASIAALFLLALGLNMFWKRFTGEKIEFNNG
jgi:hypothetical protein